MKSWDKFRFILTCMNAWGQTLFVQYHQWSRGGRTSTICTYHYQVLFAWPFFNEHKLSQKLDDLEAACIYSYIVISKLTGFVISNRRIAAVNCITYMLN